VPYSVLKFVFLPLRGYILSEESGMKRRYFLVIMSLLPILLWAQTEESEPEFGMNIGLGVENIDDITYNTLSLTPDIAMGKIGVGLDITLNYQLNTSPGGDPQLDIREEDWIADGGNFQDWLQLYLSKIIYLRYGVKGNPLYLKFGAISDGTLGNGFIMGNYSNMLFRPEIKPLGLSFDIDSRLFGIPYGGVETFVGNLAAFDVVGSRLFVRPIAMLENPILQNLQLGLTLVADNAPFYYAENQAVDDPNTIGINEAQIDQTRPYTLKLNTLETAYEPVYYNKESVVIWGIDFKQPILNSPVLSLAAFGDVVFQNQTAGSMVGVGGRFFQIFTYGGQLRFMGQDFLPTYFNQTYDLDRTGKYLIAKGIIKDQISPYQGWLTSFGTSMLNDLFILNLTLDGPFQKVINENDENTKDLVYLNYPHLRGLIEVKPGLLPRFSFAASYDKRGIKNLDELTSLEDSLIGARVNYQTGPAVISFIYDLKYNNNPGPGENSWDVSTKLETSISLY